MRELKSVPIDEPCVNISGTSSLDTNIRLFKEFFRGRTDVYAKYWISRKTGTSGYSPVCKNEWMPKVYQKAMVKCSECPPDFVSWEGISFLKYRKV